MAKIKLPGALSFSDFAFRGRQATIHGVYDNDNVLIGKGNCHVYHNGIPVEHCVYASEYHGIAVDITLDGEQPAVLLIGEIEIRLPIEETT